ncbi:carbohydrate ABC transporter permease [Breznakiella homolactica]|uniref:Sugar ABC transporter permease n=1 Tax=Breznakiella homolactica TaxID=2798577 RepID=A0A7T7XP57_9SPIR|nr:sugar ABC transporter permease [Breznakiella homolactica]QQO09945.1 sugar ABC transporter permease [Breznakiella homolactica]
MKINRSLKRERTPYLLILPSIILLAVIILIPSLQALGMSFTNYTAGREPAFIGITNYVKIFQDPQFLNVLLNNLYFLAGSLVLELLIGMGGALLLNRRFKFQPLWICLILSPYAISPVVSVVIWKYLLDPAYGMVNYVIGKLGFEPVVWFSSTLTSFIPIILVSVWKNFPFMVITLYAALSSIPVEITEASKIDGVSRFTYFRSVTLPLIMPPLSVGLMFRVIFLIRTFEQVWVFTGGGPGRSTEILAILLYKEAFLYLNFGKASAVAWVLLFITFILSVYLIRKSYKSALQ